MIRHLVRLAWNRKRSSSLLLLELFVTFLVVALVSIIALYQASNWRKPLGFDWRDLLVVQIDYQRIGDDAYGASDMERFSRLLQETRAIPEVEAVAGAHIAPFTMGGMDTVFEWNGREIRSSVNDVTDEFAAVAGLDIVAGRWFSAEDSGTGDDPVVVDRELAGDLFGSAEAAIGRSFGGSEEGSEEFRPGKRIVGVVGDYRPGGELDGPGNFYFRRVRLDDAEHRPLSHMLLRARPGSGIAFEERLNRRLAALAPDWSFEVRRMADDRAGALRLRIVPLAAGAIVGSFLLSMVALGLIGVVWQNVAERTREIGLRRALGATGRGIRRQFVVEMLILVSAALLLGTVVILQLPLLDLLGAIPGSVVAAGLILAIALITLLAGLAAWLPSRLAGRVTPSAALRYE
ncbi:MAG: ABC transporter permease [Thermoanaerobaculia bacterium]